MGAGPLCPPLNPPLGKMNVTDNKLTQLNSTLKICLHVRAALVNVKGYNGVERPIVKHQRYMSSIVWKCNDSFILISKINIIFNHNSFL